MADGIIVGDNINAVVQAQPEVVILVQELGKDIVDL